MVRASLAPALVLFAFVAAWELLVRVASPPRTVIVPPSTVLGRLASQPGLFLDNAWITLAEVALGLVIGLCLGLVAAVAIVHSRFAERTVYPLIVTSQVIPTFALAPLLVLWLGFGLEPKVAIVVILVFFPITVNTIAGLRSADPGMVGLMRSYRASRWQILRIVLFPAALPYLLAATQLAVTYAVLGAVFAEWFGAFSGLGKLTLVGQTRRQTDLMLASALLITLLALVLFVAVRAFGALATPWLRAERTR